MSMKKSGRCLRFWRCWEDGSEARLSLTSSCSADEGREEGALRAVWFSEAEAGGEVSGVMVAALSAVFKVAELPLTFHSRELVSAGVSGGDCIVEAEGEWLGEGA